MSTEVFDNEGVNVGGRTIRTIDDLNPEIKKKVEHSYNVNMLGWGLIILIFWTVIIGSIILSKYASYFDPSKPSYKNSKYDRGKADKTSYLTIFVVSVLLGLLATIVTIWLFSLLSSKKEMK